MKKVLFTFSLIILAFTVQAQVLIDDTNTNGANPVDGAALEVRSNDKGFIVPRLSAPTSDMEVVGMIFYDTTEKCYKGYDDSGWNALGKECTPVSTNQAVYTQNFETTTTGEELSYTVITGGNTYTGDGDYPNSPYYVSASTGYGVSNGLAELEFGPVNTVGSVNADLTFRLASFSTTTNNGADGADYVSVFVSADGGTSWSEELTVNGNSNARYGFDATGSKVHPYDGDNVTESITTVGGTNGKTYLTLSGLPQVSNLKIRIKMENNTNKEIWVIDDVVLTVQ